jgi:hypothetical protein
MEHAELMILKEEENGQKGLEARAHKLVNRKKQVSSDSNGGTTVYCRHTCMQEDLKTNFYLLFNSDWL